MKGPAIFLAQFAGDTPPFDKLETMAQWAAGLGGWAVLEWECCLKHPEDGAREGAPFIRSHMIRTTAKAFDDFAGGSTDAKIHARILGLER